MEKEFNLDQDDVVVTVVAETLEEEIDFDYSNVSTDDYATADEREIDWSTL